jgi:hypothetical protein
MGSDSTVLEYISEFYLSSGDFNGVPVRDLRHRYALSTGDARHLVERLLSAKLVDVMFGNAHSNPHIRAYSGISHERQLEFLAELDLADHHCVYPAEAHLTTLPLDRRFEGRPYELELARGAGQLDYRTFDLSVLEHYRNDPRYYYETNFIGGSICVSDDHYKSESMPERDQVLLQTFGFAYDDELNRAVAVFLRYLAGLSPEHQRLWHARSLPHHYKLHPDYYRATIEVSWGIKLSIFEALPMELKVINEMAALMGKPPLFRQTFAADRPKEFGFLLRPTLAEFNAFVLLLDKMLSDNLNKDFFAGDIPLEEDRNRADGKIEVRQKGTIALLEEWVQMHYRPHDKEPVEAMFKTFREVRRLRQQPAHSLKENVFDMSYFKTQRGLVVDAYDAVRTLRLCLANHPNVQRKPPEIHENLVTGDLWDI